jgi:hypothetical protein
MQESLHPDTQSLAGHDRFWACSFGDSSFGWKVVEQLNGMEDNVDHQELGDPVKR